MPCHHFSVCGQGFIANQNRLMMAGACELLAQTMRMFAGNKDVQVRSCFDCGYDYDYDYV